MQPFVITRSPRVKTNYEICSKSMVVDVVRELEDLSAPHAHFAPYRGNESTAAF
jgi:hypothetical protein